MTEPVQARLAADAAISRRSSGDQVASYVRTLILSGQLRQGDRIRQDDLATTLGVSRIPVREAIIALNREGWLTSEPHRGAFVNGFDRDDVADHYEIIGVLYGLAARRAIKHMSAEAKASLTSLQRAVNSADNAVDLFAANESLIRQMFILAHSPRLSAISRVMSPLVQGNFFEVIPGAIDDQKKGVSRIVKAMIASNDDTAAVEWQRLLRRQAKHVLDFLSAGDLLRVD
jgi:DNA-binding GntR family transcriptional regulator